MIARLLVLALVLSLAGCGGDDEPAAPADPRVQALLKGGLTLVFRHSTADNEIDKQERLDSCDLQRNLTVAGRDQATAIGKAIEALKIPVGDVRASPMCRTHDTAQLIFGRVTDDEDLISPGVIGTKDDDARRADYLKLLADMPPDPGRNVALVTHTGNIGSAFGEETVQEGEMLMYGAGSKLVGRIRAEEWAGLAAP